MNKSQPIFVEQQPAPPLTFDFLRRQNVARCDESFQMHGGLDGWSVPHWTMAITGELGELCNKLKKIERGETVPITEIAHEAADVQIYLDLLCAKLGIDLGMATREKFNIVSDRVNSKRYL